LVTINPDEATAARSSTTAVWGIQRGDERVQFQLALDASDFTEKAILDNYNARSFYESDVSMLMLNVLRSGDVVFDVGANCGYFSVLAASLVGPRGHVMAMEPAPSCLARLKANLQRNALANVSVVEKVVTDRAGETIFHLNRDNNGGHALWNPGEWPDNNLTRANPASLSLAATTLDAEWKSRALNLPKLIKIDTEGAEERVLRGAQELVSDCKVPFVVAELHEFGLQKLGSTQASLRALMENFGYSTFSLYFSGAMPKFVPRGCEIRCPFFINILFSTPERIAEYWPIAAVDPRSPL
jgi:FkbM family methyltransferase